MAFARASLILSVLCGCSAKETGPTDADLFSDFISKHGRAYKPETPEFEMRRVIFLQRLKQVETHNSQGVRSWTASINKLADRTDDELARLRGWRKHVRPGHNGASQDGPSSAQFLSTSAAVKQYPNEFNWMNLTAVKEVQDQGQCGSCWAFASALVLRAHSEIWRQDARKFSVEQIISCTANPQECGGTGGCGGATAELAMDYVFKHGCQTEAEMPYTQVAQTCPHESLLQEVQPTEGGMILAGRSQAAAALGMTGWEKLPENKFNPLKTALVTKGPVAVSVAAGYAWNQYGGGVLDECQKDVIIDHAVVLIGYGEAKTSDSAGALLKYWQLQNSWGMDWGEQGYIRIARKDVEEETEHCGIDVDPQIGSGCKGGPSQVRVCGMCGLFYDTVIPHFEDKRHSALLEVMRPSGSNGVSWRDSFLARSSTFRR